MPELWEDALKNNPKLAASVHDAREAAIAVVVMEKKKAAGTLPENVQLQKKVADGLKKKLNAELKPYSADVQRRLLGYTFGGIETEANKRYTAEKSSPFYEIICGMRDSVELSEDNRSELAEIREQLALFEPAEAKTTRLQLVINKPPQTRGTPTLS